MTWQPILILTKSHLQNSLILEFIQTDLIYQLHVNNSQIHILFLSTVNGVFPN